jgi:hypothetical protein
VSINVIEAAQFASRGLDCLPGNLPAGSVPPESATTSS